MSRTLKQQERKILDKLLTVPFPARESIRKQLVECLAESTDDDDNYGSIYLIPNKSLPAAKTSLRVPVEALVDDADGSHINILLHVVNGYINELEIVKLDGGPILSDINTDKMVVNANDEDIGANR